MSGDAFGTDYAMTEKAIQYFRVGKYAAEVEIDDIFDDTAWSPYVSCDDALKLDRVRTALETNEVASAAREAKVLELTEIVQQR